MPNIENLDFNNEMERILRDIRVRQAEMEVRNAARELVRDIRGHEEPEPGLVPRDPEAPPIEAVRPRVQVRRKEFDGAKYWFAVSEEAKKEKEVKTSAAKLKELKNKVDGLQLSLYQINKNLLDVPSFVRAINKQLRRHKTVKFRLKTQVTQRELAAQIAEILWQASKDVDQIEVL